MMAQLHSWDPAYIHHFDISLQLIKWQCIIQWVGTYLSLRLHWTKVIDWICSAIVTWNTLSLTCDIYNHEPELWENLNYIIHPYHDKYMDFSNRVIQPFFSYWKYAAMQLQFTWNFLLPECCEPSNVMCFGISWTSTHLKTLLS